MALHCLHEAVKERFGVVDGRGRACERLVGWSGRVVQGSSSSQRLQPHILTAGPGAHGLGRPTLACCHTLLPTWRQTPTLACTQLVMTRQGKASRPLDLARVGAGRAGRLVVSKLAAVGTGPALMVLPMLLGPFLWLVAFLLSAQPYLYNSTFAVHARRLKQHTQCPGLATFGSGRPHAQARSSGWCPRGWGRTRGSSGRWA